jgi:hypothetical protein
MSEQTQQDKHSWAVKMYNFELGDVKGSAKSPVSLHAETARFKVRHIRKAFDYTSRLSSVKEGRLQISLKMHPLGLALVRGDQKGGRQEKSR